MSDFGLRRRGEQLVHGPALVGFDVAEGDPAELVERDDRGDGLGEEREGGSMSGVEREDPALAGTFSVQQPGVTACPFTGGA